MAIHRADPSFVGITGQLRELDETLIAQIFDGRCIGTLKSGKRCRHRINDESAHARIKAYEFIVPQWIHEAYAEWPEPPVHRLKMCSPMPSDYIVPDNLPSYTRLLVPLGWWSKMSCKIHRVQIYKLSCNAILPSSEKCGRPVRYALWDKSYYYCHLHARIAEIILRRRLQKDLSNGFTLGDYVYFSEYSPSSNPLFEAIFTSVREMECAIFTTGIDFTGAFIQHIQCPLNVDSALNMGIDDLLECLDQSVSRDVAQIILQYMTVNMIRYDKDITYSCKSIIKDTHTMYMEDEMFEIEGYETILNPLWPPAPCAHLWYSEELEDLEDLRSSKAASEYVMSVNSYRFRGY